jgi:hypothetical protein
VSLRSAISNFFSRSKRERAAQIKRDSDRVDEAQKRCASVTLINKQAQQKFGEVLRVNETLHADVRAKMPTRKIEKQRDVDDTGVAHPV